MTHSQTLTTRRRKEKAKKRLARLAKQAEKLREQKVKVAAAEAPQEKRP